MRFLALAAHFALALAAHAIIDSGIASVDTALQASVRDAAGAGVDAGVAGGEQRRRRLRRSGANAAAKWQWPACGTPADESFAAAPAPKTGDVQSAVTAWAPPVAEGAAAAETIPAAWARLSLAIVGATVGTSTVSVAPGYLYNSAPDCPNNIGFSCIATGEPLATATEVRAQTLAFRGALNTNTSCLLCGRAYHGGQG